MKRKIQVKRGGVRETEVSPAWVQGQILWTLKELGVHKILESQEIMSTNMDVLYLIMSDLRTAVQSAQVSTNTRAKIDDMLTAMTVALDNIANMVPTPEPETNEKLSAALAHCAQFKNAIELQKRLQQRAADHDKAMDILDLLSEDRDESL